MAKNLNELKPTYPAYVDSEAETAAFAQRNNTHYCKINSSTPMYGKHTGLHDCIEDLIGRLILRCGDIGIQVTYCPVCGKKARSQP